MWQSPPFAATVAGLQMKKLIVPDGHPSASSIAETIAWSLTEEPTSPVVNVVVVPVARGVVTVVVSSGPTVTHSPWDASLDPVYVLPVGVYTARKQYTPALCATIPGLERTEAEGGVVAGVTATSV